MIVGPYLFLEAYYIIGVRIEKGVDLNYIRRFVCNIR